MHAFLLAVALLQAESGTSPVRPLAPAKDAAVNALLKPFRFTDKEFSWRLKPIKEDDKVAVSWLTFRTAAPGDVEENNTVWAKVWQPKDGGKDRPAAVFLHWLGGKFMVLEIICRKTAERGIPSLLIYLPHYGPRRAKDPALRRKLLDTDLERTRTNIRQAVLDVRRARDWMASRADVDPDRVGLVGISLGAILGGLSAGVDGGFARTVLVIGGGDLPAIVMHGSKETREYKEAFEKKGVTIDALRAAWKDVEPCTFASRLRADDVLMINAESDEIIPKAATLKLHEAIGKPEIKWFKGGHYAVAFRASSILKDIVRHLSGGVEEEK